MRFLIGVIVGATLGALIRRVVGLAVLAAGAGFFGGAIDRIGPLRTTGADLVERVQNLNLSDAGKAIGSSATLVRAVDGDTLVVRVAGTEKRVRVLGIDTPETVRPGAPVDCWGPQASASAKRWASQHRRVKLRRDSAAPDEDRYGRLLRYVDPTGDGRDLSTVQVAGGHATVAAYGQRLSRLSRLRAAERRARRADRGLWGACRR